MHTPRTRHAHAMHTPSSHHAHATHTPWTGQVAALRQLFVPDEAQAAVWRLLGAILLLGEVTFEQEEGQVRLGVGVGVG